MSQETKIEQLEKDMVGVRHALMTQNDNLKRIEEVLIKVSETLDQTAIIRERVNSNQKDVDDLKKIFNQRKEITDNNNKAFSDFTSRLKGGLTVFLFMFTLIQAMSVAYLKDEDSKNEFTREKVQAIKEDQSVMKDRLERLERQNK